MNSPSAIRRLIDLVWRWSFEVDETHAKPGTVEEMRELAAAARAEYSRLSRSPSGQLDAMIKAFALRELDALSVAAHREWVRHGAPPRELQYLIAALPEAVALLMFEHVADAIDDCEICRRRAPCRLQSDRSDSGERDWRCAWGCPPPEEPAAPEAPGRLA